MSMIRASARVVNDLDAQFAAVLRDIVGSVDEELSLAADDVERTAKSTAAFKDKSGTLRKSISKKQSKFEGGGFIVTARSPHAHLVEFGHILVLKDKNGIVRVAGHVPAHPFLRPALDAARSRLIAKLQTMKGAANG